MNLFWKKAQNICFIIKKGLLLHPLWERGSLIIASINLLEISIIESLAYKYVLDKLFFNKDWSYKACWR